MDTVPLFLTERKDFHASLLASILTVSSSGAPSNSDSNSKSSVKIAAGIAEILKAETITERLAGQTSGQRFEQVCTKFLESTFPRLSHLRPGQWEVRQASGRKRLEIAKYSQYTHLTELDMAAKANTSLAAALGNDYLITPDITISRRPENDEVINSTGLLVDPSICQLANLRQVNRSEPILHASISCKWTIRSDRAQNSRSEALNLIRNRKGHLPHIVVVTAEPMPARLASIALGTGDIDCVYHFALYELKQVIIENSMDDALELLSIMIEGGRLKDISDLPLDLAI